MLDVAATCSPFFSWVCTSFPTHLQEDKENCFIFLAFSLLDNRSMSIFLMIAFLLCNKYLSFSFGSVQFWLLLVAFVFFVGVSVSDYTSSFLSLELYIFVSLPVVIFCVACLFVPVIRRILFLFIFLLLCFLLWLTYVFYFFFCRSFSFRISFDWSWFVFFSPCSSSFSFFVVSSPQAPACAWGGKPWKEQFSHFVCLSGIFVKMSFVQNKCFCFSLVAFFVHRTCFCQMFLEYVLWE